MQKYGQLKFKKKKKKLKCPVYSKRKVFGNKIRVNIKPFQTLLVTLETPYIITAKKLLPFTNLKNYFVKFTSLNSTVRFNYFNKPSRFKNKNHHQFATKFRYLSTS